MGQNRRPRKTRQNRASTTANSNPQQPTRRGILTGFFRPARNVLKAPIREATTFKPVRGPNAISRREFNTRAGVGIGILGAATVTRFLGGRISEYVFPSKRYHVSMAFLEHGTRADANQLCQVIEEAIKNGKPFHCIAMESQVPERQREEIEKYMNELAGSLRKFFLDTPLDIKNVEDKCFRTVMDTLDAIQKKHRNDYSREFYAQVIVLAAKYNMKFKLIESYSEAEMKRIKKISDAFFSAYEKENEIAQEMKSKKEFSKDEAFSFYKRLCSAIEKQTYISAEITREKNKVYERRLIQIRKELGTENASLRNSEIRVLGAIGSAHADLYSNVVEKNQPPFHAEWVPIKLPNRSNTKRQDYWIRLLVNNPNLKIPLIELEKMTIEGGYFSHKKP